MSNDEERLKKVIADKVAEDKRRAAEKLAADQAEQRLHEEERRQRNKE